MTWSNFSRSSIFRALLAEVFEDLLHRALAHEGTFEVKRLIEDNAAEETTIIELKPVLQQQKLDMNACVNCTNIDYGIDEYYEFVSKSYARVDAFVSLSNPPNELMPYNLFYQYPIGPNRFVPSRISRLAKALGWKKNSYAFVFVVPSKQFDEFQYQTRMTVSHENVGNKLGSSIQQFALKFGGNTDDEWVRSLSKELEILLQDVEVVPHGHA